MGERGYHARREGSQYARGPGRERARAPQAAATELSP